MNKAVWQKNVKLEEALMQILEKHPHARNDKGYLMKLYYLHYHGYTLPKWLIDKKTPKPDSVLRVARRIQNTYKKFEPVEKVKKLRQETMASERTYFGK